MASGKTSNYYKSNDGARKRRNKQQAKYNKTNKGLKIRTAANKLNRNWVLMATVTVRMLLTQDRIKVNLKVLRRTVPDLALHDPAIPYS